MEITEEMRAIMTPEELAAINDEQSPEELAALKAVADAADDDTEDDDKDSQDEAQAAGSSDVQDGSADAGDAGPAGADQRRTAAAEDSAGADGAVADVAADDVRKPAAPVFVVELPADFEAQVKAVADERAGLAQQFKDGDIDFDEFNAKVAAADARARELDQLKLKHDIAADMAAQQQRNEFIAAVQTVAADALKDDGIDYAKDTEKQAELDRFAQAIGNRPENANKSFEWVLREAHKRVCLLYDITPAATKKPDAKPADKITDKKAAAAARKPDLSKAPQTLAQVPGGDGPGDVESEFSDLDRLNGDALEDAIAQMAKRDPAKYQRYMQGM